MTYHISKKIVLLLTITVFISSCSFFSDNQSGRLLYTVGPIIRSGYNATDTFSIDLNQLSSHKLEYKFKSILQACNNCSDSDLHQLDWNISSKDSIQYDDKNYYAKEFSNDKTGIFLNAVTNGEDIVILRINDYQVIYLLYKSGEGNMKSAIEHLIDSTTLFVSKPPEMPEMIRNDTNNTFWFDFNSEQE